MIGYGNTMIPNSPHATLWQPAPVCQDSLTLDYTGGTLDIGFTLMTSIPATWTIALAVPGTILGSVSIPVPVIQPAASFTLPIPGFPHIGTVGVLTFLSDPALGALCDEGVKLVDDFEKSGKSELREAHSAG
jgi:hypothetical protein